MEIKIKTLTPIWTGGVDSRKCDRIHETGIIGSLRWWYEAIVRGLGGRACDPTSNTKCEFNTEAYKDAQKADKSKEEEIKDGLAKVCHVCELFGCTGWGRKFRLVILNNNEDLKKVDSNVRNGEPRGYDKDGSPIYYKVPIKGLCTLNNTKNGCPDKPIIIEFVSLRMEEMEYQILNKILKLIEKYGGLGANLSQGNGIIKIIDSELDDYTRSLPSFDKTVSEWIKEKPKTGATTNFPNLYSFFFVEFQLVFKKNINDLLKEELFFDEGIVKKEVLHLGSDWKTFWNDFGFLPIAPHIRFAIRRSISNKNKRHEIFGYVGNSTLGSKVFVSHGYKAGNQGNSINFRIYGYFLSDNEIDGIGDFLRQRLECALFQDNKNSGRIEQLKVNSSFLIKDGKTTVERLSQIVTRGEDLLNGL